MWPQCNAMYQQEMHDLRMLQQANINTNLYTLTSCNSIMTRPSDVVLTYVLTGPVQTRFLQFVQCAQYC
jgi:hypothetical protein